ncbi:hypothetical protein MOO46_03650 [Apilactobacillus apisilvae]|uniref:Uncharacterized protein n=1 Tax=Apilactobacillus apisilvae TaxID=2923364 RepID=A0ABY4PJP2_9LACO|nr:hypothetical protein [Apilactobacillus apisilvae]UQS85656.1 hypothetical protein MOO46_03650 [Apilactobacillus apisilvae]
MSKKLLKFNQLNEQSQLNSVKGFSQFFVKMYRDRNMEIISADIDNSFLWDIDREVYRNRFESIDHAAKDTVKYCMNNYRAIINDLNVSFLANGTPELPWEEWYQNKYNQTPEGL